MNDLPETATLPSGAVLTLKQAPFSVGMKLLKTTARELATVNTGLKLEVNLTDPAGLARLFQDDIPLDVVKNAIFGLIASDAIELVLGECIGRCLYNGRGVDKDTFEAKDARGDYLPVAWEVMKLNLLPFFSGLRLKSPASETPAGSSPK